MSIQDELNQIKSAVYGADVRDAIHDSIKKTYDDASANGNANMEVEMARGTEPTLNDRLDATDAHLAQTDGRIDNMMVDGTPTEGNTMLLDGAISASGVNNGTVGTNIRKTQTGEALLSKSVNYEKLDDINRSATRLSETTFQVGATTVDDKETGGALKKHRFSSVPAKGFGKIKTITLKTAASGPQRVLIVKIENEKVYLIGTFLVTFSFGKYSYQNGVDFTTDIEVPAGSYIGVSNISSVYYGGTEGSFSITDGDLDYKLIDGETVERHSYGVAIGALCETNNVQNAKNRLGINTIETNLTDVQTKVESMSLPETYLIPHGKKIPRQNYPVFVDSDYLTTKAKITSLNAKLHLRRGTSLTSGNTHMAFVDFANNTIGFYQEHSASVADPPVYEQKNVNFPFVVGHEYKVDAIRKDGKWATIQITDTFTFQTDSLTVPAYPIGTGWGERFVQATGDITTYDDQLFLTQPCDTRVLFVGDSYIEGGHIHENRDERYSALIKRALHGNAFINGKGGARSADGLGWFNNYLLNDVDAEYTLIAFGMNESDYALWLSNIQTMIDLVTAKGSIPVLVTIPPVAGVFTNPVHAEMSTWIRNSGHLYIDAAIVMSSGYDGLTPDPSKTLVDEVHPTIESHNLIYKRALVDVPELFV